MNTRLNIKKHMNPERAEQLVITKRPHIETKSLASSIEDIFDAVSTDGDEAIKRLTTLYDKVNLDSLQVSKIDIINASQHIKPKLKDSIQRAYDNIFKFHNSQRLASKKIETSTGVTCWQESRGIDSVGLYIPGGSAPLFSTVLMLGVPAQIAECQEIILCTPPNKNGSVHPAILFAAELCGISKIFKIGGAQAIASLVIGTESVPKVTKIFGPGNQYVTAAKLKAIEYGVAIDLPAGPSEVLVFADSECYPEFIAADLISQAEHGPDSQVIFVTISEKIIASVEECLHEQLNRLPRRSIAEQALENAHIIYFESLDRAFEFINEYAPEHLIIASNRASDYIGKINNAGSVFLGNMTPESAGDYASGTNHTLPTSGFAKSYSGVSLDSFIKKITFQTISIEGIKDLGPSIINMAEEEELEGHANAVRVRLQSITS